MKFISAAAAMVVLVPSFVQASDTSRVAPSASFFGIYVSFFIDSAPAPTINLLLTACFITALIGTNRKFKTR